MFVKTNTARVERQRQSELTIILVNPPYNAWQANENDNNKNRKYSVLDKRSDPSQCTQ
jgi:predicted helicase